jgi:hypothetical protein
VARPKKAGITWYYDTLTPTLGKFVLKANVAIAVLARELAQQMRDYAQANASWEDRSGEARRGLDTSVNYSGFKVVIDLYHQVDYGIWLEVRWSGRYAIILPTLEHFEDKVWPAFELVMAEATLGVE